MELILWAVVLLLLGIQSVMCTAMCLFLLKQLNVSGELPVLPNPVKAIKEHKASKEAEAEAEAERDRISIIMQNVENYDGTANNQADVPWR